MSARHWLGLVLLLLVSACEPGSRHPDGDDGGDGGDRVEGKSCASDAECDGNAFCAGLEGKSVCVCKVGWSGAGCNTCDPEVIDDCEPKLAVSPVEVSLEGDPDTTLEATLQVTNTGSGPLVFSALPRITTAEEPHGKFTVFTPLAKNCEGTVRSNPLLEIAPGECASVPVQFTSEVGGTSSAVLILETNDPDTPVFEVPVTAATGRPQIEVCAFDGTTGIGCWNPTDGLLLDFGEVQAGSLHERRIEIRSLGARALRVTKVEIEGVKDYSASPTDFPWDIAPGETFDVTASLALLFGGARTAQLLVESNDPAAPIVTVDLVALGDGPGMCLCVALPDEPCVRAMRTADFGEVTRSTRADRVLHIASCGTEPLDVASLELVNDRDAFSATLPSLPVTLAPGAILKVALSFQPEAVGTFEGKLIVSNGEVDLDPPLVLKGEGVMTGCKLEPSPTEVNFGEVSEGITARRSLRFVNVGSDFCTIPRNAVVTSTSGDGFALVTGPTIPKAMGPQEWVTFELSFTPAGSSGTSAGEFSMSYVADQQGAAERQITVSLSGTAIEPGPCKLAVQPDRNATGGVPGLPDRSLGFGKVRIGRSKVLSITLQNVGGEVCTLNPATIRPGVYPLPEMDNSEDFTIVKQPIQLLQPGDQTTIDVQFAPTKEMERCRRASITPLRAS